MNLSLPYSSRRRYLTGIDWVVGALHEAGKKSVGIGAVSQAVLEVDGVLDESELRTHLDAISKRFPQIHGQFARDWLNLAPYWKVPQAAGLPAIPLRVVQLQAGAVDEANRLLSGHVNESFESDRQHLRFLLINVGNERSFLGLMFDHRLFDALGAEVFFRLLDQTSQGELDAVAPRIRVTEPAHLDQWPRRFGAGKMLNRMLVQMQANDICAMKMPEPGRRQHVRFVHDDLTVEQTARINQLAFSEIGMPILLPSAAARAVAAVRQAIPNPPLPGSQYLLFTSANMRPPGQEWETMFFNHFSFLPLTVDSTGPADVPTMATALRDQFFGYVKDKIPQAMQDAALLGRIFPRTLVARVINSMFKGRMCSFYFACIKETGYASTTFMGRPTVNLTHTPAAFVPPGLNLCLTFFAGRFNIVLSYIDGVMGDATARQIVQTFKTSLIAS